MLSTLSRARKALAVSVATLGLIALSACTEMRPIGFEQTVNPARPVPVALLLPVSDTNSALVARSIENAARLAAADLEGARIELQVYDTAGNPAIATDAAVRAVREGAKIIVGPLYAAAANAAGNAVASAGVNVLSFSNNPDIAGGNVFILGQTFDDTADRLTGFATSQGLQSIVIARPDSVEGEFGSRAIRRAATHHVARVVGEEVFEFSEEGVIAAAPRIADLARSTGADTLFLTSTPSGALPFLAQLLPENGLGPDAIQWIGLARWDIPSQTLALPGLQGGWFAMPDPEASRAFARRYREAYGEQPHPLAGLGFDAVAAIGALLAEGRRDALSVVALTRPGGFRGANGAFRLLPNGTNQRALAVAEVVEGRPVVIDPAPYGFGGF